MAVKPWVGAIKAPSNPPSVPATPPGCDLELEWVHGYAAQGSRSNLRYTAKKGSIVYHAAALGITMELDDGSSATQRFQEEHTDDVVCLAVHPTEDIVATGQLGKKPLIVVWDASTQKSLVVLKGFHKRAVTLLAFSSHDGGKHLASIGDDNDHSVAVYR
jgi:microtubule-associated protein-like 6